MKTDAYTKTILTVIALLLAVIVLRPVVSPTVGQAANASNYSWFISAQKITPENLERATDKVTASGCEVTSALPVSLDIANGFGNLIGSSGTAQVLFILKCPNGSGAAPTKSK
jgi:hypothetical protein